jgi:hypothetical protein
MIPTTKLPKRLSMEDALGKTFKTRLPRLLRYTKIKVEAGDTLFAQQVEYSVTRHIGLIS